MANLATTTYKVTGTREAVNNLWTTFQDMEVDSKDIRLFKLAEHYGIDYEKKQISVRGHIYWAEYGLNMKKTKRMIISSFHLIQKPHGMHVTNSSLK